MRGSGQAWAQGSAGADWVVRHHSRIAGVAFLASVSHGSFLAVKQGIQWLIADSAVELYQTRRRHPSGGAGGLDEALVTWLRWASAPDA